jgi:hypothetical protein
MREAAAFTAAARLNVDALRVRLSGGYKSRRF